MNKSIHIVVIFLLLPLVLSACSTWRAYIPAEFLALGTFDEVYTLDNSHFFGPAGINNVFVVYDIPEDMLALVRSHGIDYFANLPSTLKYQRLHENYRQELHNSHGFDEENRLRNNYRQQLKGLYRAWGQTPISDVDDRWNHRREKYYHAWLKENLSSEQRWKRFRGKYRGHDTECNDASICSFYGDYKAIPERFKYSETLKQKTLEELNFTDEIAPDYRQLIDRIIKSPGAYYAYGETSALVISPEHKKLFLLHRG